jgi:hypothetical protein
MTFELALAVLLPVGMMFALNEDIITTRTLEATTKVCIH